MGSVAGRLRAISSAALLAAAACVPASHGRRPAQPQSPGEAETAVNLYAWFDTLGYDAVKGGRFVCTKAWWDESMRGEPEVNYGFLVKDGAKCFTILTPGLEFLTFSYSAMWPDTAFHPADFTQWVATQRTVKPVDALGDDVEGPLTTRGRFFVISRACDARGLKAEASEFLKLARHRHGRFQPEASDFKASLSGDIATHAVRDAIAWICDADVSRPEVKARLEELIRLFPHGPRVGLAKESAALLGRMIVEDQAHQAPTVPLDQMPTDAQVAELIFELRDQPGAQYSSPGVTEIFRGSQTSPANRLVKLGYAAVPRLLDALRDDRFTRAMFMARHNAYYNEPIPVKVAAALILSKIANKTFYPWEAEAKARTWWKQQQAGGEEATLIAGTERADQDSPQQAKALAEKYPADAVAAIRVGLSHSKDWYAGPGLIDALLGLNSPEARALAREQMAKGKHMEERLAAARVVSTFDADSAVRAMIAGWRLRKRADPEFPSPVDPLVEFLAGSGRVDAVEALAHDLRTRGPAWRCSVVRAFMFGKLPPGGYMNGGAEMHWGYPEHGLRPQAEKDKARYRDCVEDLLAGELTDTASNEFRERACDSAAEEMAGIWPDRYTYKRTTSLAARHAMRVKSLNTWRRLRGKPFSHSPSPSSPK